MTNEPKSNTLVYRTLSMLMERQATIYAILGGISIFLLVFLTPPFQVPDEPVHFYRSYQLSGFGEASRVWNGRVDSSLPESIPGLVTYFMGTTAFHAARPVPQQSLIEIFKKLDTPLDAERRTDFDFSAIQSYSPLLYIPQALGIAAGRYFGFGPLKLLYIGRLTNAFFAITITAFAITLLPVGGTFSLVVALMPMTQFVFASVSPDALIISGAFFFTALMTKFLTELRWSVLQQFGATVAAVLMCSIKPVYAPLLFAGIWVGNGVPASSTRSVRHNFARQLGFIASVFILVTVWFLYAPKSPVPAVSTVGGPDSSGQIAYLIENPVTALRIPFRTFYSYSTHLWQSTIGKLGWLNVDLNAWVYVFMGIAATLGLYAEKSTVRVGTFTAIWIALLGMMAVHLIIFAMYIGVSPVGAYAAQGVQGRYFLPLLPAVGISCASLLHKFVPVKFAGQAFMAVLIICLAATISMHHKIIEAYKVI
jgi:uncharacterized membrane protein